MLRAFWKSASKRGVFNSTFSQFNYQRQMHTRNKKALELIAKGYSALKEVDRVIDYCELKDKRLIPLLRTAKQHFELALEADNSNTHARYWLSKLHFKYHVPGANKAVGAALLVEAAEMGDPDALYELGCGLRVENEYVQSDQQAFYFIEKAVDQLHPGALYLLGAVYLTGDCVNQDVSSAIWCFHRASEKGHAGAAIAYGSLLLREGLEAWKVICEWHENEENGVLGHCCFLLQPSAVFGATLEESYRGVEVPESITRLNRKNRKSKKLNESDNRLDLARWQFEIAAKAGNELGVKWLKRLEEEEKSLLDS